MRLIIITILWFISSCACANDLHPSLRTLQEIVPTIEQSAEGKAFTGTVRFVPLGFSPAGKFAYIIAGWDDACGSCPHFDIIDLTNDEIVERRVWEDRRVEQIIEEDGAYLTTALYANDISALEKKELRKFPLEIGREEFTVSVEGTREVGKSSICMHSSVKGSKIIGYVMSEENVVRTVDQIEGYLLSPHEKRIVVVMSGTVSGFEFAYLQSFYLFGSHLNVGFERR